MKGITIVKRLDDLQAAVSLKRRNEVCKWDLTSEQLAENVSEFKVFEHRLRNVTRDTRQILINYCLLSLIASGLSIISLRKSSLTITQNDQMG